MSQATNTEQEILAILRDKYESQGYSFYEYPDAQLLPEPLRPFQLDAIALKGPVKVVIEVKTRRSGQGSAEKLADVVRQTPGWDFELVLADSVPSDSVSPLISSLPSIQEELEQAERLEKAGFKKAAFISAWSALEALARLVASELPENSTTRALRPRSVVTRLSERDLLTPEQADELYGYIETRNRLIHGDLEFDFGKSHAARLIDIAFRALQRFGGSS